MLIVLMFLAAELLESDARRELSNGGMSGMSAEERRLRTGSLRTVMSAAAVTGGRAEDPVDDAHIERYHLIDPSALYLLGDHSDQNHSDQAGEGRQQNCSQGTFDDRTRRKRTRRGARRERAATDATDRVLPELSLTKLLLTKVFTPRSLL